jgi:hypothetical protein
MFTDYFTFVDLQKTPYFKIILSLVTETRGLKAKIVEGTRVAIARQQRFKYASERDVGDDILYTVRVEVI